jgi:hypothetical protein
MIFLRSQAIDYYIFVHLNGLKFKTSKLTRYMSVRCNGEYLYTDMSLFSDAIKNQLNNHNK